MQRSRGAAHEAISHYGDGDLTPETHLAGGCTASFVTSDDADAVIEHYRSELLESGYTIRLVDSVPIEGEAGAIIGQAVGLEATNGPMFVSVSAEAYDGRENTYQVFTEEVEPSE